MNMRLTQAPIDTLCANALRFLAIDAVEAAQSGHPGMPMGMAEIAVALNGIALHGGFIPFGATFLVFSDYARNAIRMNALMKQRVVYVMTHDSIGLGEDGPPTSRWSTSPACA